MYKIIGTYDGSFMKIPSYEQLNKPVALTTIDNNVLS